MSMAPVPMLSNGSTGSKRGGVVWFGYTHRTPFSVLQPFELCMLKYSATQLYIVPIMHPLVSGNFKSFFFGIKGPS